MGFLWCVVTDLWHILFYIDKQLPCKSFAELSANILFTDYQQYSNRLQKQNEWDA